IFAHSSLNFWDIYRYNSVFTLLRKVEVGDLVAVFYQGNRYDYKVVDKKIVPPTDTSILTSKADGKQLTLQTCDPPGLNLNRIVVLLVRSKSSIFIPLFSTVMMWTLSGYHDWDLD